MAVTPVQVLIVLAHPEPQSFNAALCRRARTALTARGGHAVTVSDLCAEGFDPVAGWHDFTAAADPGRLHYQAEQAHAARTGGFAARHRARTGPGPEADLLILQFPLWWGGVPAILKGWFERVLAYGFAYADGLRFDRGVFRGRRAMVSMTTGGPPARFGDGSRVRRVERQVLWQVQHLTLEYMGFAVEPPFVAYAAPRIGDDGRAAYLDDLARRVIAAAARPVDRGAGTTDPLAAVEDGAWAAKT